jgi:hypothetical protein
MSDDDNRPKPMYVEDFEKENNSTHVFWGRELKPNCHPEEGFDVEYKGYADHKPAGLIELKCTKCKRLIGKVVVSNDPAVRYADKTAKA